MIVYFNKSRERGHIFSWLLSYNVDDTSLLSRKTTLTRLSLQTVPKGHAYCVILRILLILYSLNLLLVLLILQLKMCHQVVDVIISSALGCVARRQIPDRLITLYLHAARIG